jgi:hypothetical protein
MEADVVVVVDLEKVSTAADGFFVFTWTNPNKDPLVMECTGSLLYIASQPSIQ